MNPETNSSASDLDVVNPTNLKALLSSLALGVRAVSALPTGDDFEYAATFPEYAHPLQAAQESLLELMQDVVKQYNDDDHRDDDDDNDNAMKEDQELLLQACADACDAWLEQADAFLKNTHHEGLAQTVKHVSSIARRQAANKYSQMMDGLVDMSKPQITFDLPVDNARETPFVPSVHPDKPFGKTSLDLKPKPGRAMDTSYGGTHDKYFFSGDDEVDSTTSVIGPTQHVPHPYRTEINQLEYADWMTKSQFEKRPPDILPFPADTQLDGIWIDTPDQLQELATQLQKVDRIAIDLEAHSYRSFAGMTCLMQITILVGGDKQNYLVDTLKLWKEMNSAFASIFANPAIVKVFHGADSDITWLQRDFGLYVVNLFDTGRAARCLKLPSFGLAYLLEKYVNGLQTDKSLALADWRQRPLPPKLKHYAVLDTYYLLDIYELIKWDLSHHSNRSEVNIDEVLKASRQVSLIRYDKEPFDPNGYKSLMTRRPRKSKHRSKSKVELSLTDSQEAVLKSLYDWRDLTARNLDEAVSFVATNGQLIRLAMAEPTSFVALQSVLNPIPEIVLQESPEIIKLVQQAKATSTGVRQAPSSAFFKPAEPLTGQQQQKQLHQQQLQQQKAQQADGEDRVVLASPVMGTEDLYKEAGWMTPLSQQQGVNTGQKQQQEQQVLVVASTTSEEEGGQGTKSGVQVDEANRGNNTGVVTSHSLSKPASSMTQELNDASTKEQQKSIMHKVGRIQNKIQEKDMLGLISPTEHLENQEVDSGRDAISSRPGGSNDGGEGDEEEDEEFVIPKSMREIYKISNRNRRNKKVPSPVNVGGRPGNPIIHNPMKVDTVEGANELLDGYFEHEKDDHDQKKRQKTGNAADDTAGFLVEIGWVKDREEAEAMKKERANSDDNTSGTHETVVSEENTMNDKGTTDHSSNSAIQNLGVYNPNAPPSSNPFFAGVARRASTENSKKGGGRGTKGNGNGGGSGGRTGGNSRSNTERPSSKPESSRAHAYKSKR